MENFLSWLFVSVPLRGLKEMKAEIKYFDSGDSVVVSVPLRGLKEMKGQKLLAVCFQN